VSRPKVVLATRNLHKIAELARILEESRLLIELVGVSAFADVPDVAETGATFAENALLKAHAVAKATGLPAVADDSGLCVDALAGMPGVLSARWSGRHGDDLANLRLVLDQLEDVPDDRLGAAFHCSAALALPDGEEHVAEGHWPGRLTRVPRGENGFGYDPIFVPEGESRTSAEMPDQDKDAASHRGRALRALVPTIAALVAAGRLG
jgi:XTP/dITP diphosphohydrolase